MIDKTGNGCSEVRSIAVIFLVTMRKVTNVEHVVDVTKDNYFDVSIANVQETSIISFHNLIKEKKDNSRRTTAK